MVPISKFHNPFLPLQILSKIFTVNWNLIFVQIKIIIWFTLLLIVTLVSIRTKQSKDEQWFYLAQTSCFTLICSCSYWPHNCPFLWAKQSKVKQIKMPEHDSLGYYTLCAFSMSFWVFASIFWGFMFSCFFFLVSDKFF